MRNTARQVNVSRQGVAPTSAANTAQGASVPAPIGGWDAYSPIAAMPEQNAITLVNFFPQPGSVDLRRGHVIWCDTGSGGPVESLMGYMGQDTSLDKLFAATQGSIYDVTTSTAALIGSGYGSNRWQFTNFAGTGGSYTWMCNGTDVPQYWDGTSMTVTTLTGSGFTPSDIINCVVYRQRIWGVLKDSTKAVYLGLDSVDGACGVFDVGNQFINGGYLIAIGTWSTDATDGPQEYISFLSSQGDVAIYIISDPSIAEGIAYRGRAEISQPVGYRCLCKIGGDLGVITLDGVLPISQVLSYDKAALLGASITKNIRAAINEAMRTSKNHFGWQLHSYPRGTMAILNVPLTEGEEQEQYVMNTITGAWARFTGQNANAWEVFLDHAYFGGNDGVVRLADTGSGDENQTLSAEMVGAFNYYQVRGQLKNWTMLRPNVTIANTFPVLPYMGINVDFGTDATLDPFDFNAGGAAIALWNSAVWNAAIWPGNVATFSTWTSINGFGYCASVRMTVDVPWTTDGVAPQDFKINGFDSIYSVGAFI
jgi:hypothetical protein